MTEKIGLIYALMPKIMLEIGAIPKTRENTQGRGYMFRGIDDLYLAVQGPIAKNGVFFAPKVLHMEREERKSNSGGLLLYTILTVQFTFFGPDGSSVELVTVGEAFDSGDKSANKAMSAALKYALLQVFCIPTEGDNDTENHSPDPKFPVSARPSAGVTPGSGPHTPRTNSPANGQPKAGGSKTISDAQRKRLFAISTKSGWFEEDVKALIKENLNLGSTKDIPAGKSYDAVCGYIEKNPKHA